MLQWHINGYILQYIDAEVVKEWYECVKERNGLDNIAGINGILFNQIIKKLLSVNVLPDLTSFHVCHLNLENMRDLFIRFPEIRKEDLEVPKWFVDEEMFRRRISDCIRRTKRRSTRLNF